MPGKFDTLYTYEFIKRISTPFEEMAAFKAGIIDGDGKVLKRPVTQAEKDVFTSFDRLVVNLKRIISKIPGGKSKMGSFAAALFLLREDHTKHYSDNEIAETLRKYLSEVSGIKNEDAPANSVGNGVLAGIDNPAVNRKKKKKKYFSDVIKHKLDRLKSHE